MSSSLEHLPHLPTSQKADAGESSPLSEGLLPLIKPVGKTSFHMVACLRKITGIRKIGHAGTLDPFATGVMLLLIGKSCTRLSDQFLHQDKRYTARLHLGITTDSFDIDGAITATSLLIPSLEQIEAALDHFEGGYAQTPPMFSAKKIGGKRLYHLARQGIEVPRPSVLVTLHIQKIAYAYPHLEIDVTCSKGTYIRSLAHDIGQYLGCGAHLTALTRTQSGPYLLEECCTLETLSQSPTAWKSYLRAPFSSCISSPT